MVYIHLNVQPRVILITSSNNYEYYFLPWLLGPLVVDPILFLLIRKANLQHTKFTFCQLTKGLYYVLYITHAHK